MAANGKETKEYWNTINAVNKVLRRLDLLELNPTIEANMVDLSNEELQKKIKNIEYYDAFFTLSLERENEYVQRALAFIKEQMPFGNHDKNKLAISLIEYKYNFSDVIIDNYKIEESVIIDESKKIQKILYEVYKDNSTLLNLNSREFEEMIAELLYKQGYNVELTQQTRDGGYDIIALMDIKMHNPLKFLVECKHFKKGKVGVDIIRSFKNVIDSENANRGIIVTSSYFTRGALQKQQETPYLLDYRDKDKVIEWVEGYFK